MSQLHKSKMHEWVAWEGYITPMNKKVSFIRVEKEIYVNKNGKKKSRYMHIYRHRYNSLGKFSSEYKDFRFESAIEARKFASAMERLTA